MQKFRLLTNACKTPQSKLVQSGAKMVKNVKNVQTRWIFNGVTAK